MDPLMTLKWKLQVPAGKVVETENGTPVRKLVPAPVIPKVPMPVTTTETESGARPRVSATVMKNLKFVAVVPVAGVTPALDSVTVRVPLPFVQLAAWVTAGHPRDASRSTRTRSPRTLMCPPSR